MNSLHRRVTPPAAILFADGRNSTAEAENMTAIAGRKGSEYTYGF